MRQIIKETKVSKGDTFYCSCGSFSILKGSKVEKKWDSGLMRNCPCGKTHLFKSGFVSELGPEVEDYDASNTVGM